MAWGRRTTSAQTPAWSQDDYHTDFAAMSGRPSGHAGQRENLGALDNGQPVHVCRDTHFNA